MFRDIRKFGRVWCGSRQAVFSLPALRKLGPEALEISAPDFRQRLGTRRGRIKSVLLDQTFLAGLGNIYADEALFAARLHPESVACRIGKAGAARLYEEIRAVLGRAIDSGGSSIDDFRHPDGSSGWFQRVLLVYGRTGEPCVRCTEKIQRIVLGQRGTWFCSKCQRKQRACLHKKISRQ